MSIKRDLSDMPHDRTPEAGLVPDEHVRFGLATVAREAGRPDKEHAEDTPFRYSMAGTCARRLSYYLDPDVEREPFDMASLHVMRIGTLVHEDWQSALGDILGDSARFEVKSNVAGVTSGHADAVVDHPEGATEVVELKTKGGFGYKRAVGDWGPAQGPDETMLTQLALNVDGNDADSGVLVMMGTEAVGKRRAASKGMADTTRFVAEWTFTRQELQRYADAEVHRLGIVSDLHDQDVYAPRHVPYMMNPGARIVDPDESLYVVDEQQTREEAVANKQTLWSGNYCLYCPFLEQCKKDMADGV